MAEFLGTIIHFDDRLGKGVVRADSGRDFNFAARTIVGRSILTACRGERALVRTSTGAGDETPVELAIIGADGTREQFDPTLREYLAKVIKVGDTADHYFLQGGGRDIYLHDEKILSDDVIQPLAVGDSVSVFIVPTTRGFAAIVPPGAQNARASVPRPTSKTVARRPEFEALLSRALLARDARDFARARTLYREASEKSPSKKLFFSWASMEKQLNNADRAMAILRVAIGHYPTEGKFYEDLGHILRRQDTAAAAAIYDEGLRRDPNHRILHLFLARSLFDLGGEANWRAAIAHFVAAKKLGLGGDREDNRAHLLSRIRVGPPIGGALLAFLDRCGWKVEDVEYFKQDTRGFDVLASPTNPEYVESYDLRGAILFRCYSAKSVDADEVEDLREKDLGLRRRAIANQEIVFIALDSIDQMRDYLYRVADANASPVVVPLEKSDLNGQETDFRGVLDRWLYRRDLFDVRNPVSGRRFFGREREIRNIRASVQNSEWVGLFGLRKIGKTSFVEELARRQQQDIVALCDLLKFAGVSNCDHILLDIAGQFDASLNSERFVELDIKARSAFNWARDAIDPPVGVASLFRQAFVAAAHAMNSMVAARLYGIAPRTAVGRRLRPGAAHQNVTPAAREDFAAVEGSVGSPRGCQEGRGQTPGRGRPWTMGRRPSNQC